MKCAKIKSTKIGSEWNVWFPVGGNCSGRKSDLDGFTGSFPSVPFVPCQLWLGCQQRRSFCVFIRKERDTVTLSFELSASGLTREKLALFFFHKLSRAGQIPSSFFFWTGNLGTFNYSPLRPGQQICNRRFTTEFLFLLKKQSESGTLFPIRRRESVLSHSSLTRHTSPSSSTGGP